MSQDAYLKALKFAQAKGLFLEEAKPIQRVLTGISGIDWLTGGGIPLGRIIELYGFEGSGKTTLAAHMAKVMQLKSGKKVIYLDYEHSVDLSYFKKIGLNLSTESFLYGQPDYMEQGLDLSKKLIETEEVCCLIVDSVASMVPKAELEGTIEDYSIGLQARKMGQALRILTGLLEKTNTVGLFINQLRDKVGGNPWETKFDPTVTPGGRALKFYASIRLELKKAGKDDDGNSLHRVKLRKQKTCALQTGTIEYKLGENGIDELDHLIRSLFNTGVLAHRGSSIFLDDQRICQGKEDLVILLKEDATIRDGLSKKLIELWSTSPNGSEFK